MQSFGGFVHASEWLREVLAVLRAELDIVGTPVEDADPPAWCNKRGWGEFLLSLGERELNACEENGLAVGLREESNAPSDLLLLAENVRRVTALPRVETAQLSLPPAALRGVGARKREQLGALLGLAAPFAASAGRVVDVGAGSGHLARLSAELFQRTTLALERDVARLGTAQRRTAERAENIGTLDLRFSPTDVGRERLELAPTDLAIGLHACGDLGDRLVLAAAAARCDLVLCSCCFQKIPTPTRAMLSQAGGDLTLKKPLLGLANLTSQAVGVEATLGENLNARQARLGLRRLLRARGLTVAPGEEMRGINRRRAQARFSDLATRALAARSLPPPTPAELSFHADAAAREHATVRRLSLPRHLLARVVELAVVLDRAAALEEHGQHVLVAELFEQRVTPRNTVLIATADPKRLAGLGSAHAQHVHGEVDPG
jgi:predicted RNA methylase